MVAISKKPTGTVSSLATPYRNRQTNYPTWRSTWKIPSWHTDSDNPARCTGIRVCWRLGMGGKNGAWGKNNPDFYWTGGTGYTTSVFGLNNGWNLPAGLDDYTKWYPYTKYKLYNIYLWVQEYNNKGNGPWSSVVQRSIGVPPKPVMSDPSHNKDSGIVSVTIKQDRGYTGNSPCQYTWYSIWIRDSRVDDGAWTKIQESYSRSEEFSLNHNVEGRFEIGYDDWIELEFNAKAYGYNGSTDNVRRRLVISYPAQALIKKIEADVSRVDSKTTVHIDTRSVHEHFVTGCKLQILKDVDYERPEDIPSSEVGWEDTESVDDRMVTALSVSTAEAIPSPGKKTWVRVKTWNQFEDLFYRYSVPMRIEALEQPAPSAENDQIKLVSVEPNTDGQSALATIVWDDGTDVPSTGTELTWSPNVNAWRSTEGPNQYEFSWSDGPMTIDNVEWPNSAQIHIESLIEGVPYYVRARRFLETDTTTTFSAYTEDTMTVIPSYTPPSVSLSAPLSIARGNSIPLSWVFSSEAMQTSWYVIKGHTENSAFVEDTIVASGSDAIGSYVIDADLVRELSGTGYIYQGEVNGYEDLPVSDISIGYVYTIIHDELSHDSEIAEQYFGDPDASLNGNWSWNGSAWVPIGEYVDTVDMLELAVRVSTGGGYIQSESVKISIADPPILSTSTESISITSQGFSWPLTCSVPANISVVMTANGVTGEYPDGIHTQVAGDSVYSDVITPDWTEQTVDQNTIYSTLLSIPQGLQLYDGAQYSLRFMATDPQTGLSSEYLNTSAIVEWEHQAPVPTNAINIQPFDIFDETGFRLRGVEIQLTAPTGYSETDTYEIYRITSDNVYLVCNELPLDAKIVDYYAPYGSKTYGNDLQRYRVAVRTADGDVDWLDFPYLLDGYELRIDFGSQYIELPWNLTLNDRYQKDFESRAHLGSSVPEGYWNENISKSASLSTEVIRVSGRSQIELLRELGRYSGPVFIRTPDGSAYQANINVGGLDDKYNTLTLAITLDATEVGLTSEYAVIYLKNSETSPDDSE